MLLALWLAQPAIAAADPDLAIVKSGPVQWASQVPYSYTLTLANVGTAATSGLITVTDTLQGGLVINSISPGLNFSCSAAGQIVTCTTNSVISAAASGFVAVVINVTPMNAGGYVNLASVSGGGDSTPGNDTSPPVNTEVTFTSLPNLAAGKTGPATATVGAGFSYALTVSNVGASPTFGVVTVTDTLPVGVLVGAVTPAASFACNVAAQTVTCSSNVPIGVGANDVPVATIQATPMQVGVITNTATVSTGGDTWTGNDTSPPISPPVSATPQPDLVMGKTGPASATVGVSFDYRLALANAGAAATTGPFTVTDTVPWGLTIHSVAAGPHFSCTVLEQSVTCVSDTAIAAGMSNVDVATVSVTPTQAAAVTNVAMVSGGGDTSPGNNTRSVNTAITPGGGSGSDPAPSTEPIPALSPLALSILVFLIALAGAAWRRKQR